MTNIISLVKGLSYRTPTDIAAARLLDKGDKVILQKDPDNVEDKYAIKVLTIPGNFIGYVDREFSEMLTSSFDYLIAEVKDVRHTEIPYIHINIQISDTPVQQPAIITDPSKLSATERMMILDEIVKSTPTVHTRIPDGYGQIGFGISWTEELPSANILRARLCKPGDSLKLVVQSPTRYPGRIEVYTTDDVLIGYIDEQINRGLSECIDKVSGASIYSSDSLCRMSGILYLPADLMRSLPSPQGYVDYYFKEVSDAAYLAQEDPLSALDMIQYAMDHEKGIYAKEVALKCYWHLKDWEARKTTALRILEVIDSLNPEITDPFTYESLKTRRSQELIRIIETCDKRLQSKKKNRKNNFAL